MRTTLGVQTFARSENREIYGIYSREFDEKILFAIINFCDFGVSRIFASLIFRESGRLGKKKIRKKFSMNTTVLFHSTNTVKSLAYKANFNSKLPSSSYD